MTIYYDPTEAREGTRLPKAVIAAGKVLPGLEMLTGGDILISALGDAPLNWESAADNKPRRIALRKHTESGLLVQRKTGRDLVNSIVDGHLTTYTLARMLEWSETPWLAIQGDYKRDKDGLVVVDGFSTNCTWSQLQGAMEAWQLRQGYITVPPLPTDTAFCEWINRWSERKISHFKDDVVLPPRKPQQIIVGGMTDDYPFRSVLACFPDIGAEKATDLAEYCGSLWASLMFLSCASSNELPGKPKGIGAGTIRKAQAFLGLPVNTALCPLEVSDKDWNGLWGNYVRVDKDGVKSVELDKKGE
jgi:ERCC4-type nuclease